MLERVPCTGDPAGALHDKETSGICQPGDHAWRTVRCDGVTDVVECHKCGRQEWSPCNFDDDFA